MGQALWKTIWSILKKLKIELPCNPAIALLGICPKDMKTQIQRGTCTPLFIAALSTIAKLWREPKCPLTEEWIRKMCIYIHNGILLSHQKRNLAIYNDVDGTGVYYASETSQRKTDIT